MTRIKFTTVRVGDLVFFDSFSGLIPTKVVGYTQDGRIRLKVTANRRLGGYLSGEYINSLPSSCIPRNHTYSRQRMRIISGTWRFEGLDEMYQPRWA